MVHDPGSAMRAEIAQQPDRVHDALTSALPVLDALAPAVEDADHVVLLGRGSSRSACSYGALVMQNLAGKPATVASPADLAWGTGGPPLDRALVVAVSQSGESTEMVAAAERALEKGGDLVVITNTEHSTLAGLVGPGRRLLCRAGVERAVPATKSFTTSLACLLALAQSRDPAAVRAAAADLPAAIARVLDLLEPLPPITVDGLVVAGEGLASAVAEEGAIKFREVLKMLVASLEASEFLHGSITSAQPDVGVVSVAVDEVGARLAEQIAEQAAARGAPTVSVAPRSTGADHEVVIPAGPVEWLPFTAICPLQVMALEAGIARGLDPDAPVGLSKVTRIAGAGN